VTSVRAILFRGADVLVQRHQDATHILPGGRREADEGLEETLRRELLEETCWTIRSAQLLGCKHFHHLSPKPTGYRYPYPDFMQAVYTAEADQRVAGAAVSDSWVVDSGSEHLFLQSSR